MVSLHNDLYGVYLYHLFIRESVFSGAGNTRIGQIINRCRVFFSESRFSLSNKRDLESAEFSITPAT